MRMIALRLIPALAVLSGAACSLPALLHKNLDAIQASTAAITSNNDVVKQSTRMSEEGIKSFEGLRAPMESVASLNPTLKAVAALDAPMTQVAGLASGMRAVGGLQQPMARLADLQPSLEATAALAMPMERLATMRASLDAVAALRDPMASVAALRPQLADVADLGTAMHDLSALKQPLEQVAELRDPMIRLAALGAAFDHPIVFALLALAALVAWGGVTFIAVRLAIVSAAGRHARLPST